MASKSAVRLPAVALPVWSERCNTKVNGEMQTDIQYYHRIVVVVLVSTEFPIPLGVRFQKNAEGEVACALALLHDLVGQLGRRFLDVLVGDALYLQAPFVKEVERLGLVWAFTLKENQPELLREAERLTQESPPGVQQEPDREIRYWHLPEVDWPVADRQIRSSKRFASNSSVGSRSAEKTLLELKARLRSCSPALTSTLPISNWARSRPFLFIGSVAAVGASIQKSFRRSPPIVISNTPRSIKPPPW